MLSQDLSPRAQGHRSEHYPWQGLQGDKKCFPRPESVCLSHRRVQGSFPASVEKRAGGKGSKSDKPPDHSTFQSSGFYGTSGSEASAYKL